MLINTTYLLLCPTSPISTVAWTGLRSVEAEMDHNLCQLGRGLHECHPHPSVQVTCGVQYVHPTVGRTLFEVVTAMVWWGLVSRRGMVYPGLCAIKSVSSVGHLAHVGHACDFIVVCQSGVALCVGWLDACTRVLVIPLNGTCYRVHSASFAPLPRCRKDHHGQTPSST